VANQKLTESLLANASYEIRINELTTQITTLEESLQIVQTSSAEQIEALQSELTQKNTECESLNAKLESANQDIERAKVLLKKVAELNKKKPS
jgi:chromosome segregation ATPase